MSEPKTQTERLHGLQDDMQEMYEAAKLTANASLMHKLAGSVASLVKQIKEQELHDGEVIKRPQAIRFGTVVGTEFAKIAKDALGEDAIPLLAELALQIELIAEAELA